MFRPSWLSIFKQQLYVMTILIPLMTFSDYKYFCFLQFPQHPFAASFRTPSHFQHKTVCFRVSLKPTLFEISTIISQRLDAANPQCATTRSVLCCLSSGQEESSNDQNISGNTISILEFFYFKIYDLVSQNFEAIDLLTPIQSFIHIHYLNFTTLYNLYTLPKFKELNIQEHGLAFSPHFESSVVCQRNYPLYSFYMSANNNQKEYIDIPLNIEDTPLHLFEKFTPYTLSNDSLDLGFDFISRIDSALRSSDCSNQLLPLYFNYFQSANSSKFAEKDWPACHQIETKYEDKDFNAKVQSLYNELRQRSRFQRIKPTEGDQWLDIAEQSWDNYESILQRESKQVNFPPIIAWEIIENFLSQLSKYYQLKQTLTDQSKVEDFVFNINKTKKLLSSLSGFIPADQGKVTTSKQNFAYFALLALAILQVYEENYQKALQILSRISLESLATYSRSLGALFSLFLTASYAYFMLEQYKESARLAEMALSFYQKNKKYFAGVTGERTIARQFQKLVGLLCLDYIFLEERPKPLIFQAFKSITIKIKDKQNKQRLSEKYTKLRQNDQGTFVKLFQFCALPSITENSQKVNETVLNRFHQLHNLTLNSILHHYTQISVAKIAKMLKISEAEVSKQIESFNNISTGSASWDRTIMQPLLNQTRKIYVEVTDGIVKLDTDETNLNEGSSQWEQYRQEISWLVQKVNSL